MTAPVFVQLTSPQRREPLAQAALVSLIVLALMALMMLPELEMPALGKRDLLSVVFAVLLIELGNRCYRAVRTEPGRYVLFILFGGALVGLSIAHEVHPLLLGGGFGVVFGLRARAYREGFRPLEEGSGFLGPFILGSLAAGLEPHRLLDLGPLQWEFSLIYVLTLVVGKTAGGMLGSRITGSPLGIWALSYAQGVALPLLLPAIVPTRLFLGSHAHDPILFVTGLLLLAGVLPALAVSLSTGFGRGSGSQPVVLRERAAASGGIGLI